MDTLYLHEEILLIVLNDEKGTEHWGTEQYQYVLAGAIVAELALADRIVVDSDKKKLVNVISEEPFGNQLLDEALESISTAKRRKNLKGWVQKFVHISKMKNRIAEGLCQKGILRQEEGRFLLLFSRKTYPEENPLPERALIQRLRDAIFNDDSMVDTRTAVLISLTYGPGLLAIPFDSKELRGAKKRILKICDGEMIGKVTNQILEEIQAAIVVAVIMPTVTST
jgi:golgi phosphoprotein 3